MLYAASIMKDPFFTTSWDDGHPLDLKLADLLCRHGCTGTFYVPCRNLQGRPVLAPSELRSLAGMHEVASHTLDHCYLDGVDPLEAKRQIAEGKRKLEDWLGHDVTGFAYPGGIQDSRIRKSVAEAGFAYARTIEGFRLDLHFDPHLMPTTIQFHPHSASSYLRNFVKRGRWRRRAPALLKVLRHGTLQARLIALLDLVCACGGLLHLWGHSWEIEKHGSWQELAYFLASVAERVPEQNRIDNRSVQMKIGHQVAG